MFEKERKNYHNKYFLTVVISSILLVSFSEIAHSAFAMGPSSCYNQYDAPFVSFMVNNGSQTFDLLTNPGVTFNVNTHSDYNFTFVMHTPSTSSWNNTNPGTVGYVDEVFGYFNSHCISPVGPNQNITITGIGANPHAGGVYVQYVVFGAAASTSVAFNVHWISAPYPPQNLMANASLSQINLSWSIPATNEGSPITNYNVYRGTSSGNETLLTTTGNVTSYNDTTVTKGQTYFYKVTAINSVGESSQSNEASATPTSSTSTSGDKVIATIPVGSFPYSVVFDPANSDVYVTNFYSNTISVISTSTNTVIKTISDPSFSNLCGMSFDSTDRRIYVCHAGGLSVINGSTNAVIKTIQGVSGIPVFDSNNHELYLIGGYPVSALNVTTDSVISTIRHDGLSSAGVFDQHTGNLYLVGGGDCSAPCTLNVINGTNNNLLKTIYFNCPYCELDGVTFNPNNNHVYVAFGANRVGVFNDTTYDLINTISDPSFSSPSGIAFDSANGNLYVANTFSNTISVINGATDKVVNVINVGNGPRDIAVDPNTNQIYVTNSGSNTISVIQSSLPTVPQSPTGLTATAASSSQINLSWSVPSDNGSSPITGYEVERSTDSGITWFVLISNTNSTSTTYSDTGLTHSTVYAYRVSAINSVGSSNLSNTASATTLDVVSAPPTGLTATPKMPPRIDLNWTAPNNDGGSAITGYMIERSTNNGVTWSILVQNTNDTKTAYTDSHLKPVTTYTYRVSAINGIGTSDPSNTASAKPLSAHGHP